MTDRKKSPSCACIDQRRIDLNCLFPEDFVIYGCTEHVLAFFGITIFPCTPYTPRYVWAQCIESVRFVVFTEFVI